MVSHEQPPILPNQQPVVITNLAYAKRCMYCTLPILGQVIGCPITLIPEYVDLKHNDIRSNDEYITYGVFCSYNCAMAYAISKGDNPLFSHSKRYISIIASKENNEIANVIPSPPIELMSMYGGYMTEEQYRSEIGKVQYLPNGTTVMHPLSLVYNRK